MSVSFQKYYSGIDYVCRKNIDFSADTFNLVLSNTAQPATLTNYPTGVNEISTQGGYVQGTGIVITASYATATGISTLSGSAALLTSATPNVQPFRYVILYDSTSTSKALLGFWDNGSTITMANTDTFQVSWSGGNILQFS